MCKPMTSNTHVHTVHMFSTIIVYKKSLTALLECSIEFNIKGTRQL